MGERQYNRLYRFAVTHSFYEGGKSSDFRFIPMGGAVDFIRAHRILFKETTFGFDLAYQTDGAGVNPIQPIEESNKLSFAVMARKANVLNLTDFPAKSYSSDIYFAAGKYDNASLNFLAKSTRRTSFQEIYEYTNNLAKVTIEDAFGRVVFSAIQNGLQDDTDPSKFHFNFSVNLPDDTLGIHTIKTYLDGILEDQSEVFIYNPFEWPGIVGVVELELDESMVYDFNLPYEAVLNLDASSAVWTYRIELTRNFTNGIFNLNDTGGGGFSFNEIDAPADYLEGEWVTFESNTAITKQELPRKDFDLVVTSDDQDITVNGLPNPSPYISNSTIYLKI